MLWLWINAGHSTLSGDLPSFICLCDIFPTPLNCSPHHHHHYHRNRHHYHLHHITTTITIFATIIIIQNWDSIPLKKGPNQFLFIFGDLASQASLFGICSTRSTYGVTYIFASKNCRTAQVEIDTITGTRNSGRAILNGYEASGCRLACGVYQQGTAARQEQICSKHNRYKALCHKTKEEICSYCRDPLVVSCKLEIIIACTLLCYLSLFSGC